MTYNDLQPIVLAILTSIITGGFVLVFVEIGNRRQRDADLHNQIMTPFMHKFTAYLRFMSWCQSRIKYPAQLNDYEKEFKRLVKELGGYGGRAITSGGDYGIGQFTAVELEDIALGINNVWYWHDKMHPVNLRWDDRGFAGEDFINKELKELNPMYLSLNHDVRMVAKVSGDFYTDIYQPIDYESYRHEAFQKQYGRQTVFVSISVGVVLLVLSVMLFIKPAIWFLQLSGLLAIILLIASLLLLAIDIKKQIHFHNRMLEKMKKMDKKTFKEKTKQWRIQIKHVFQCAIDLLISFIIPLGLFLSIWAVCCIDLDIIPRIPTNFSDNTIVSLDRIFQGLSYSYIVGWLIYVFTSRLPLHLHKKSVRPVVNKKIGWLGNNLHTMLLGFYSPQQEGEPDRNPNIYNLDECESVLLSTDWNRLNNLPLYNGHKTLLQTCYMDYKDICSEIDSIINDYKEVLTDEQLLLLEEMRSNPIKDMLSIGTTLGQGISHYVVEMSLAPGIKKLLNDYAKLRVISGLELK